MIRHKNKTPAELKIKGLAPITGGRLAVKCKSALHTVGQKLCLPAAVLVFLFPAAADAQQQFWNGSNSTLWSGQNWSPDTTGATTQNIPAAGAEVIFSVTGVVPQRQNTDLDTNLDIASLTVNDSVAVSISGSNTLTISGAGLSTGITVNAGAGLVTIGSNVILAGNSQTIAVNNGAGMLISGTIGGNIGLTKAGAGLLTLTGVNTYTGATAVTAGTLQVGNSLAGSLDSTSVVTISPVGILGISLVNNGVWSNQVINDGQIQWNASGDNTQAATSVISGTGNMLITSPGTTVLLGDNTFLGGTTIDTTGEVLIGNPLALSSSAFGLGTLTIDQGYVDTFNGQILEINVGGYDQNGGEIGMHLQGITPGSYTQYNVTGSANISGTSTVFVYDDTGDYVPEGAWSGNSTGDQQTIIETTLGLTGQFSSNTPLSAFYNEEFDREFNYHQGDTLLYPTVTYDLNNATITWVQDSYQSVPGLTRNQRAVAGGLDGFSFLNGSNGGGALTFLNGQAISSLPGLYDLIAADELTAIFQMGFHAAEMQAANITQHLESVRHGARRPMGDKDGPTITPTADGKSVQETPAVESNEGRWNIFVEGLGGNANVGNTSNSPGYDFTLYGAMMGADYLVNETLVLGITGGYADSEASLINGGSIETDSYRGALYGTFFKGGFFADALVGLAYNSYDTDRLALLGRATGDTEGLEFTSLINTGYDFRSGNLTFGPVASVAYTRVNLDSFSESGSLTPLDYRDQEQESLRTNLGAKISYVIPAGRVRITPQARVTWQHEFMDSTQSIDSSFASGPGPVFTVDGPEMGRDSALVTAGVSVQFNPTVSAYAFYTGQLARTNYDSHNVTVGVRISF